MTPELTIRWTMGDWPARRFHPQAYALLAFSVAHARVLFPAAQLVIATNNLTEHGYEQVGRICHQYGAQAVAAELWLPGQVTHTKSASSANPNDRNTWWKLAPLRTAPNEHELVLDNDVILWRIPAAIGVWLAASGMLLCAGDESPTDWTSRRQSYGTYSAWMKEHHPRLSFSSGIIGFPPGLSAAQLPHPLASARTRPHHYSTEQGFLAMNYLTWPGDKLLIPWSSVPAVNDHNRGQTVERVLADCDGAHFSDHNLGRSTRFLDEFAPRLRNICDSTAPAARRKLHPLHLAPDAISGTNDI